MELHSYAKRRTVCKKWSTEHKRKLVEARIKNDELFFKKSSSCLDSWRKIVSAAQLDDFSVFLVRKQWTNMLIKYKKFKQCHLGNISSDAIDEHLLREISREWEFFYPIHSFMSRKVTNFHSYALTHDQKRTSQNDVLAAELENMLEMNSSPDCDQLVHEEGTVMIIDDINDYQINQHSQQIDDVAAVKQPGKKNNKSQHIRDTSYTDHDLFSKNSLSITNPTIVVETVAEGSTTAEVPKLSPKEVFKHHNDDMKVVKIEAEECRTAKVPRLSSKEAFKPDNDDMNSNQGMQSEPALADIATTSALKSETKIINNNGVQKPKVRRRHQQQKRKQLKKTTTKNASNKRTDKKHRRKRSQDKIHKRPKAPAALTERDKYYRHKRRFNRRLELRFDSLLSVFGQVIKAEYPSVDVSRISANNGHCPSEDESEAFSVSSESNDSSDTIESSSRCSSSDRD